MAGLLGSSALEILAGPFVTALAKSEYGAGGEVGLDTDSLITIPIARLLREWWHATAEHVSPGDNPERSPDDMSVRHTCGVVDLAGRA